MRDRFPPGVADQIGWYVYRLIDPRDGITFYVGKGKGDRVFAHAAGLTETTGDNEAGDLKIGRIREILAQGFAVTHVIHQHAIPDEDTAYRIETAVMDCFPGLTNRANGHGASNFGVRHVEQIIAEYAAPELVAREPLLAIAVNRSYTERTLYEAVRGVWKIDPDRARKHRLALAVIDGIVRGVFLPETWLPATVANFPRLTEDVPGRWGFAGKEAPSEIAMVYLGHVLPAAFRHSQNPIRFIP